MTSTDFVRAHTRPVPVPFVAELRIHTATGAIALWEKTEAVRGEVGLAPPFWAFPWAGGQALARYVLDHPECVAGMRVLDLAAGSGLVAMAALRAGAAGVLANEIDPYAIAAIALNAAANGLRVPACLGDLLSVDIGTLHVTPGSPGVDVVLAGDVFYSREMATRMLGFMRAARAAGVDVLAGDPGRAYVPRNDLVQVAAYDVPVIRDLEDADVKRTTVWRLPR